MRFFILSFSFCRGGAGFAANKFSNLAGLLGFEVERISQDSDKGVHFVKRVISWILEKFEWDIDNPAKHSLNLFSFPRAIWALRNKEDLHHIHWINNDTISIFDFDQIPSGSIISLHDEWLYCGSEHC